MLPFLWDDDYSSPLAPYPPGLERTVHWLLWVASCWYARSTSPFRVVRHYSLDPTLRRMAVSHNIVLDAPTFLRCYSAVT
jgi:hypothetical protein